MINFFRKIRQHLIMENNTAKYLKYAIGEILLVVLGILIALSINNWNDRRIKKNEELIFYKNTKKQLQDDLQNIKDLVKYNDLYAGEFEYGIELISAKDKSQIDTLIKISIDLLNYSDYDRQGNIYENIINSGEVKLIDNDQIIEGIRRLEETYMYMNRMENIHYDAVMQIVPNIIQSIEFHTMKIENPDNLYSFGFQNLFFISLRIMGEKDEIYKRALNEIEALIKLIEEEENLY